MGIILLIIFLIIGAISSIFENWYSLVIAIISVLYSIYKIYEENEAEKEKQNRIKLEALERERKRKEEEAEKQKRIEEEKRKALELEEKRRAEQAERQKRIEEEKRKALELEEKRRAEQAERQKRIEEEKRKALELEEKRRAEEIERQKRIEEEEKRKALELKAKRKVNDMLSLYSPSSPLIIHKANLFVSKTDLVNKEMVLVVENHKKHLSALMNEYSSSDTYKKLKEMLGYTGSYLQKYNYLSSKLEVIQQLKLESNTLYQNAFKTKIEIINESEEILVLLKRSFSSLLESKKCTAQGSETNEIDVEDLLCKDEPKELSLFRYKYVPAILYLNGFYFCFFSNVILVFDCEGYFSNALDPTAMSIEIDMRIEHVFIRDNELFYPKFIDIDSKLLNRGDEKTSWLHTRKDGRPDERYRYNPRYIYSYNDYEYGVIKISISDFSVSFTVSSRKALSNFSSLHRKYIRKCNNLHNAIPDFLHLLKDLSENDKEDIRYLIDTYQSMADTENYFCTIR